MRLKARSTKKKQSELPFFPFSYAYVTPYLQSSDDRLAKNFANVDCAKKATFVNRQDSNNTLLN